MREIDQRVSQVHLVRHGEVDNPTGVLYGRLPGFHLSETGQAMAHRLAHWFSHFEITALYSSPLERAQETLAPIAQHFDQLQVNLEPRVIEAENKLTGQVIGKYKQAIWNPKNWRYFLNPTVPSWGEPYEIIAARMNDAINEIASGLEPGCDAIVVSHQLPIWIARLAAEGNRLMHDPRRRQCSLASVTSFRFDAGEFSGISYAEPARDLIRGDANCAVSTGD